jgi:phosphoribosylformylglycinamidine synthase
VSTPSVSSADTVANAAATPEREQPYAALGLKPDEYASIREILGRRPTSGELAMYSVMWSEHCSYKSSKPYLRQFGTKTTPKMRENLMVGMGENAGVVDVGGGWAVTFKIESHNHPSYIEPFQGAATGVGGIVRDIISMGARPVAVMDALRFGDIDDPDTARVVHGVVSGISFYGNCLGLPNIGGETYFDSVYQANPLVNALAVGVLRHEDLHLANARGVGNKVVLFGARTGGDGIGGASILASDSFSEGGPTKRPAVQVGDPFAEKVLIECCLELFQQELVEGIQDLGAAGISCATSELASNGDGGMFIELQNVLLRDPTLTAEEILMSESQERMMAIVRPEKLDGFLAVVAKWDVETSVLGEVTDTGRLIINWHGEEIVNVEPRTVAVEAPCTTDPSPTRPGSTRSTRRPQPPCPAPRTPASSGGRSSPCWAARTWPTSAGSPTSTTRTCSATPRSASRTTAAWCASTRRAGSDSRSPRTPTAASASSTRTRARSWRSPKPSAMWL